MSTKLRVGVIFGSRSGEHEVSIVSAQSIIKHLDPEKYEILPIGITKYGEWIAGEQAVDILKSGANKLPYRMTLDLQSNKPNLILTEGSLQHFTGTLDVVFPVVHGSYGEDGALQGLLEMANVPYVGSGVLGSAISMDKVIQKKITEQAGIPSVAYQELRKNDWESNQVTVCERLTTTLGYPMFVKPANLGSSVGISKVHQVEELPAAIEHAFQFDAKLIIERSAEDIHEIEVAVLGAANPEVSVVGEVTSSNEFYDYDAKYIDGASKVHIPAELPDEVLYDIQSMAQKTFTTLELHGMARIDFFVEKKSHEVYLNEVNTIPGFTSISMYPKLWEASGIGYSELLDRLLSLALERHKKKSQFLTSYSPKANWHIE